jgi:hypothetical protein
MRTIALLIFLVLGCNCQSQNKIQEDSSFSRLCDSIAAAELTKYDEQSGRETGVPIAVEHMDRIYSYRKPMKCMVYMFNQQKFYGKSWKSRPIEGGDRFPYFFSIALNTETKEINFVDHK